LSFWDRIKPTTRPVSATEAALSPDGTRLDLTWEDGVKTAAPAQHLRQQCPCAGCVDEMSGRPVLDPARVPLEVYPRSVEYVGEYAIRFDWSDGHRTGIYPFPYLRELSPTS